MQLEKQLSLFPRIVHVGLNPAPHLPHDPRQVSVLRVCDFVFVQSNLGQQKGSLLLFLAGEVEAVNNLRQLHFIQCTTEYKSS